MQWLPEKLPVAAEEEHRTACQVLLLPRLLPVGRMKGSVPSSLFVMEGSLQTDTKDGD